MIESIAFKNFKALRDATLPLGRFTLIVGPNGSGKTTALSAFGLIHSPGQRSYHQVCSTMAQASAEVKLTAKCKEEGNNYIVEVLWSHDGGIRGPLFSPDDAPAGSRTPCAPTRVFSFEANAIAAPVFLQPQHDLAHNGANLAGVLDRLRDQFPERFETLNEQLGRWIPEFDRILFQTPREGHRAIALRTRVGGHIIDADELSQGTLIALALFTLAFLPEPPSIVCLEEPDRGLHPRLLRDVRDALYRLAHPDGAHETRSPVQVVATTHNPYFLDLFREHPEEIVIAEKAGLDATFSRLSDRSDLEEILGEAPLSEVWYSGVLGGVPVGT